MRLRRRFGAAAVVAMGTFALFLGGARPARAGFAYSTSIFMSSVSGTSGTIVNTPGVGASFTSTGGTVVTLSDIATSSTIPVPSVSTRDLGDLSVTTSDPATDAFSLTYTDIITITNPSPGGPTGTFTVTGTLTLSGVHTTPNSGTVSNLYNAPFTQLISVGGDPFRLNTGTGQVNDFFTAPAVNGTAGNLGGQITAGEVSAAPEPASLTLLATGALGLLGYGWRKRKPA